VEVREGDPGVLTTIYQGFAHEGLHRATLSVQISRTMFCAPSRMLNRQLEEIRTAAQLERHFSRRELFTIYANRAFFGEGLIGVQSAARSFFLKNPDELTISEAALIAGLVRSPSRYSPLKHSDHALERRNEVIDAMLQNGTVSSSEAKTAEATALTIAPAQATTMPP